MGGPLEGVNVLDLGQAGVGPWACSLLGMLGANVMKVERPEGDLIRNQPPFKKGLGVGYTAWNMAKKGSTFNLKDPEHLKALEPMVKEADAICENLRPGVMDRLGLGFKGASAINPKIVYASSPAWGFDGPMVTWPGVDADVQAFSGFASLTGDEGGRAEMARHLYHFDLNASSMLASTVILGLLQRDRTEKAQYVKNTHLASTLSQLGSRVSEYLFAGKIPGPLGSASSNTAPHQAFLCQDKRWLTVGVETEAQWSQFCQAIRREDLMEDARYKTNADRVEYRNELSNELDEVFADKHSRWWFVQLTKKDVPVGYFYTFEDLRSHEHVIENNYIVEMDIPHQGKLYVGGLPWEFSRTPGTLYHAPSPGQHTEEFLEKGFGMFDSSSNGKTNAHTKKGQNSEPPLTGIRVIDSSQGLCGAYVSLLLADAGAEVIKVEPPEGDYARGYEPKTKTGDSAAFMLLNRNKSSVFLDIESDDGKNELKKLLTEADIFIETWNPGQAESLGLDYDTMSQINPGLIYCAITPFGEKGSFKDLKGSELVIQAMSDYSLSVGEIGSPPLRWGNEVAGGSTASMAFAAILACVHNRNRTGEGQRIGISQWGTLLCMRQACWTIMGDLDEWEGPFCQAYTNPRMHGWQTKDKPVYLRLYNTSEEDYVGLLTDLGMEEVLADERFGNGGRDAVGNGKYAFEVMPIWERFLKDKTADEVVELARSRNAMAVPMNSVKDVIEHPQTEALGILKEMDHPILGKVKVIGPPFEGSWEAPEAIPAPERS